MKIEKWKMENETRHPSPASAPRGRDSMAQGASALGRPSIGRAKPRRGEIRSCLGSTQRGNPAPLGLLSRLRGANPGLRTGLSNLAPFGAFYDRFRFVNVHIISV